jgi:Ca-activated chloride channel homolog
MGYFMNIIKASLLPPILSFVALLFVFSAYTQTADPLQVLKEETAHSVRNWRGDSITTTYDSFELNSCTLSFTSKTLAREKIHRQYVTQIYRYAFPLNTMDVRLEWLDTYKSYVATLSGPGSVITIESGLFKSTAGNKYQAPNISIPFVNENSAKRVEIALNGAIAACGGSEPVQRVNAHAEQVKEDLKPEVNDEKFKVKVNVDLVTTDVLVAGDNVPELRAEDFIVYDNGVAQQISHFSHDQPISVALVLIGGTGFTISSGFAMQIAALSALRLMRPGDHVALYSENGDRLSNLTDDRLQITKLLRFLAEDQGFDKNILGTLYDAARYLKQEASSRHGIILISDNCHRDNGADSPWNEQGIRGKLADKDRIELLETATTLYDVVVYDSAMIPDEPPPGWGGANSCPGTSRVIKQVSEDTGGDVMVIKGKMSLQAAVEKAISQIRTQYILGFNPSNPGESGSFHELTVRLADKDRCPTCRIKARRGYYADVAAPSPSPKRVQAIPNQSASEIDKQIIQQIITIAGYNQWDMDEISFALKNAEKIENPNGQSQMLIDLSIDSAGIGAVALNGRRAYSMQAAFFVTDKKGNSLGSNFWKIGGSLSEEEYNRVVEKGIPFSARVPLRDKDQKLKIVIYDEASGRIGSRFVKNNGKGFVLDHHPLAYR